MFFRCFFQIAQTSCVVFKCLIHMVAGKPFTTWHFHEVTLNISCIFVNGNQIREIVLQWMKHLISRISWHYSLNNSLPAPSHSRPAEWVKKKILTKANFWSVCVGAFICVIQGFPVVTKTLDNQSGSRRNFPLYLPGHSECVKSKRTNNLNSKAVNLLHTKICKWVLHFLFYSVLFFACSARWI